MNPFLTEKVVKATWDIPTHPSAVAGELAAGSYSPNSGNVSLPAGAVITEVIIDVEETCVTESGNTGTAALGYTGATDAFVAPIAVSDASDVWDEGIQGSLVGSFALDGNALTAVGMKNDKAASLVKVGASSVNVLLTTAVQPFTEGRITAYIKYLA